MGNSQATELLTKLIEKVPYLKQLNHDNEEYGEWHDEVRDTIECLFGRTSPEYQRFAIRIWSYNPYDSEEKKQQKYIDRLDADEWKLRSIIKRQEIFERATNKTKPIRRQFSNRTLSHIIEILADRTDTELRNFFFKYGLLDKYEQSGKLTAKKRKINDVFQHLCEAGDAGDESAVDNLNSIVREALKDTHAWLEKRGYDGESFSQIFTDLERALAADGFQVQDGELIPVVSATAEPAKEEGLVESLLNKYGFNIAKNHLEQAYDNYLDGNWEASNAALRSFLQDVFDQIALILWNEEATNKAPGGERRKLLQDKGFIEENTETDLVKSFFKFAHGEGSHPGISDESDCRLRRYMAVAIASYYLEKLKASS